MAVRKGLRALPAVAWAGLIFWFSHQSDPPGADDWLTFEGADKIVHAGIYAVLGALLSLAFGVKAAARWWFPALLASLYGLSDEWHQSFVPFRDASVGDWVADTIGGCLGAGFGAWFFDRGSCRSPADESD